MALEDELTKLYSAFWGQSFVTELTRISSHSADKFQSKKLAIVDNAADNEVPTDNAA